MPYISDEEYRKFQELVEEKQKQEEKKKKSGEVFKKDLIERTKLALLDLNHNYGPIEAYAVQFAKQMIQFFKEQGIKKHWFLWRGFQEYLTEKCLCRNKKNQIDIKKAFRDKVRDYGIFLRIDRSDGTIKVFKK